MMRWGWPVWVMLACAACTAPERSATDDDDGVEMSPAQMQCQMPQLAAEGERPVELLPSDWMAYLQAKMPCIADDTLLQTLQSPDTIFYNDHTIYAGYQDSFGDNVQLPIGMRPNSIKATMIDLAVPGGHAQIFEHKGVFHFPFGRPTGVAMGSQVEVNFWKPPRIDGELAPVVWWKREPNGYTHRVEWAFPAGTVMGEMLFMVGPDGHWFLYEIRTRTRTLGRWTVDAYRPFTDAAELADAIERKQDSHPGWAEADDLTALVAHLRDPSTLQATSLGAKHFASAFPMLEGAYDTLPPVADTRIFEQLLAETPFRSAKGTVWKSYEGLISYAPTTQADFSIVPRNYNGGLFEVSDEACSRCHQDAGRPFRDWYPNIIAYGELWGEDETFTWHPFETSMFVNSSGDVVNFNYDNRQFRKDFEDSGLLARYDSAQHESSLYTRLSRPWKDYSY